MYIRVTYDNEFEDLIMYLRSKYPKELFDLEGIGKQMDMSLFSKEYFASKNVADVSVDSNANVDDKNVSAYEAELPKPWFRLNALYLLWKYIKKLYDLETANKVIEMQIRGDIYINDLANIQRPYCFNFSTYDIMIHGLPFVKKIKSEPPKHLSSFIGQLIHFTVFASNQVVGAVGLADLLIVASYYADKLFKDNPNIPSNYIWKQVKQEFQSFIYSCNQPFRSAFQSGFYNVSVYDKHFLEDLIPNYIFPDGSIPNIQTIQKLQELFLDLMNETLERTPITFPIVTACFSVDENNNIQDEEFLKFIAEKNLKYGFVNIYAGETGILSSCCRLRSDSTKIKEYFNTFGAGSTKIGSLGVCTINLPRIAVKSEGNQEKFFELLKEVVNVGIIVNRAKRHLLEKRIQAGSLPLYTLGFMDLKHQYSTIGVLGFSETCKLMGLNILTEEGQQFVEKILDTVNTINDEIGKKYKYPTNCEQVPAENSAIKLAQKDKLLGYQNEYELYSNQFIPLMTEANILDRIKLQGRFDKKMSGGAIVHLNVETQIENPELMEDLIRTSIKQGVVYQAINYNLQHCENEHLSVGKNENCPICGKPITDNFTRVVGFLTNTKNWHKIRREIDYPNRQFYKTI